jgi:hypothetical protein
MSEDLSLEDVLAEVRDSWLAAVHTSLPGKIVKYDSAKQIADVQPQVKDVVLSERGANVFKSYPLLTSVPVVFYRAGGAFQGAPIAAGDTGLLVFLQLSIDRWRANGQESVPGDVRRHHITSAVFLPGLSPRSKAVAELAANADYVFGFEGGSTVHVKPNGQIHLGSNAAADYVALAAKVATELNRVKSDLTALKTAISNAFFAVGIGAAANGTTAQTSFNGATLTVPSNPASVAAAKVKAD